MSGAQIAAEVAAAISEAGSATGSGTPLTATILRPGAADESTYPVTPATEAEYACTMIWGRYSARDRDGVNITARDAKALISPDAETDPRNGDRLRVDGATYSIKAVDPVKPGGVVLMWTCQVRSEDE